MHKDEIKILEVLKSNYEIDLSTTKIVENLYKDETKIINSLLNKEKLENLNPNLKIEILNAKRKKARLHRKVLYHLSKLETDKFIAVTKTAGKGEKYFKLAIDADEDIIINKGKRNHVILTKPHTIVQPIESYSEQNLIYKHDEQNWINRINACLFQCKIISNIFRLEETINNTIHLVNDAIALNDFETIINNTNLENLQNFIISNDKDMVNYLKKLNLIIDYTNIDDTVKITNFLEFFCALAPKNINIIFDVKESELLNHEDFTEEIIDIFAANKIPLYFKNQNRHKAPYFLGKLGPYTFGEHEWKALKEEGEGKIASIVCSQSTICIDVEGFLANNNNSFKFREFILNIAKTMLYINSNQRSRSNEYFKNLVDLNHQDNTKTLSYSKHYIRFWNYGWKRDKKEQEFNLTLLKSTKEIIENFAKSEEIIYKACGMPTSFKIAFSCAFQDPSRKFTRRNYAKLPLTKIDDLYGKKIKTIILQKEKIFRLFDGGDRLRFLRKGNLDPKEMLREINIILHTYKIPFLCYDFENIRESNSTLTSYLEEQRD